MHRLRTKPRRFVPPGTIRKLAGEEGGFLLLCTRTRELGIKDCLDRSAHDTCGGREACSGIPARPTAQVQTAARLDGVAPIA